MSAHTITTVADLVAYYGETNPISLTKEVPQLTAPYRQMIAASPFVALASTGPEGLDVTPRGDPKGFVDIIDDKTLALPDRRGNNRIDTLKNIVRDPRVALLFLIPGVNETLRVNGRAVISIEPKLLQRYAIDGKEPRSVVLITIDAVYFQCARALVRSKLWDPAQNADRASLPTAGQMTRAADATQSFDDKAYDAALPARQAATLY
ncbi:MAG: hypothetical protein RL291_85 [Pseudomonadota bacterium]